MSLYTVFSWTADRMVMVTDNADKAQAMVDSDSDYYCPQLGDDLL